MPELSSRQQKDDHNRDLFESIEEDTCQSVPKYRDRCRWRYTLCNKH